MKEKSTVCVTGAGGFVASWLVKLLLSDGHHVHGTVRDSGNAKNAHLKNLDNADKKLTLFNADLLDFDSILAAVKGCDGVFHVASPVPRCTVTNPELEIVAPAVEGTLNVLKACSEAKVRRVVVVSSVVALWVNPNWTKDQVLNESCWSDKEYCKTTNNWYGYSKTVSESEALEYAKKSGLDVVTVAPSLVLGPMLQQEANTSSLILLRLLKDGSEQIDNNIWIADARDVAEALKLVYEVPEAEGRYICNAHMIKIRDLVEMLKRMYPSYNYPESFKEGRKTKFSSEKLQKLGWKYRPLEETIVDSVDNYKQAGLLN